MSQGKGNFPLTFILQVQGAEQVASQFNKTKGAIEGTNSATQPLNKSLQTTDKSLASAGKTAGGTGKAIQESGNQMQQASGKTAILGESMGNTEKKGKSLSDRLQGSRGLIFGTSMLATGLFEAVGMVGMLGDASTRTADAEKALNDVIAGGVEGTKAYQKALAERNAAQAKVNELVAAGKTDTPQYTKAVQQLKDANGELNKITAAGVEGSTEFQKATDELANSQKGYRFTLRNTIMSLTDLVPLTIMTVSGIANIIAANKTAAAAQAELATATTQVSTAMKALRIAMVAVPIAAVAAALLAIKTNAFGFRDSLDALGASIGKTFPQLKPLLTWVKDLGVAFGLTEKAMDLSKAWNLLVTGFQGALKKLQTTDWKAVFDTILKGISNFIKTYDWATAWQSFKDALVSSTTWIKEKLGIIGKEILAIIKAEGPKWWAGFQEALGSTAQWVGKGIKLIGAGIIKTIQTEAPKWWVGFQEALGASTEWVKTQIGKVAQAILNYPWLEVGKGIMQKIGEGISALGQGGMDWLKQLDPFNFGGKDKDPFTPISFNQGQGQGGQQQKAGMFDEIIKQLAYVDLAVKKVQATFSAFSTSIATYANSMKTNLGLFFTTTAQAFTLLDQAIKLHQASWSTFSTSVSTYASSMTANLGNFFTTIGQAFGLLDQAVKLHQGTWSNFSTSVSTYASSMTTNLGNFFKTIVQAVNLMDQAVKLHQKTWSTFSTSLATYAKSMTANVTNFVNTARTGLTNLASQITKTQGVASKFSTSWSTYMKSMSSAVKSFASAVTSAMNSVVSAANKATAALNKMAAAAKKAASAARGAGLMHGGMRISAASGFSGIVNSPTMYGSGLDRIKVGEDFRPELVTVTPLTRGTGNHTGNLQRATAGGAGGGGRQIIEVHVHGEINEREMIRFVQRAAADGFGAQA